MVKILAVNEGNGALKKITPPEVFRRIRRGAISLSIIGKI